MKVAIVNDTLDEFGGAERVARTMLLTFPDANFYTSFAAPWILEKFFPDLGTRLYTSWKIIPHIATHRSFIQMFSPLLWGIFNLSGYDVVITNPSLLMCNIIPVPSTAVHIQYIHSIPKNLFGLAPKTPLQRLIRYEWYVRPLYEKALRNTPYILTSSIHMQKKIFRIFGVTPTVLPPPVRVPARLPKRGTPSYYLCISRLDRDKHLELAILACNRLKKPLLIAGKTNEPRYEAYLRSLAGPTVTFLGFQPDTKVRELYRNAIAFLFPSKEEDFGIAPLEALAYGVPVIAYYGGGPKETLVEGKTGTFFYRHNEASLVAAMKKLQRLHLSARSLYRYAHRYDETSFKKRLNAYIREAQSPILKQSR